MMLRKLSLALCVLALGASTSSAALVYGTSVSPADFTGARQQADGELITSDDYEGVEISWVIVDNGDSTWTYSYTFTGFDRPAISHWILDLSDDAVEPLDPDVVTDIDNGGSGDGDSIEFGTFSDSDPSNPGLLGPIIGVKFDFGSEDPSGDTIDPWTVSFTSNRAPVWGDIYVKGGNNDFARNAGNTLHGTSENILDFVARPNSLEVIPEPSTILSCGIGLGLLGIAGLRRARRTKA